MTFQEQIKNIQKSRIENISKNFTNKDELIKGGKHKTHKYLRMENDKYIYDHSKMNHQDHKDAAEFHKEIFNDNTSHGVKSESTNEHNRLAKEHEKLAKDKEEKKEKLTPKAEKFLDTIRISDNNIELKDIEVEATPKGNWAVYWKGKSLMTVNSNLLDDQTIMKYALERHETND